MISIATPDQQQAVRNLWKAVFGDTDSFLDRYFAAVFRPEQTLVCTENGELKASLQLLPYTVRIKGQTLPATYIYAVMTDVHERKKGYMRDLMAFAFDFLHEKEIPLTFLIPQEEYLFDIYAKYGFEKGFWVEKTMENVVAATEIDYFFPSENEACDFYCRFYQNRDAVLLSESQFRFMYYDILQEKGKILAVKTNDNIAGLCFAYRNKIADLLADDTQTRQKLLKTASRELGINQFHINQLPANLQVVCPIGMFKILDSNILQPKDLQNCYLSLMMNE